VAMSESLRRVGWECERQARLQLDERRDVDMEPDLLCRSGGVVTAVLDAKYKAERPAGFPNADLYQMLAYCTVLGLNEGHLVYAKGNEVGRTHTVQRAGVVIHCRAVDLALEPAALLTQVDQLADAIVKDSAHQWAAAAGL
jgi:5-methylcytosine-specific restriction enzyme subunit McrC